MKSKTRKIVRLNEESLKRLVKKLVREAVLPGHDDVIHNVGHAVPSITVTVEGVPITDWVQEQPGYFTCNLKLAIDDQGGDTCFVTLSRDDYDVASKDVKCGTTISLSQLDKFSPTY